MTDIASGDIRINLNDAEALAGLHRIEAQFDRTMAAIDREKATVTIKAETAPFDDAVANAKRQIKALEGQQIDVEVDSEDFERLSKEIAKARKELVRLNGKRAEVELKWKQDEAGKKANEAEFKRTEKRIAAIEKRQSALLALQKKQYDQLNKSRKALNDQYMREMRQAENEAYREDAARTRAREADQKRLVETSTALQRQFLREMTAAEREAHSENLRRDREAALSRKRLIDTSVALQKQYAAEMSKAEREAHAMEAQRKRELAQLPQLQHQYVILADSIEKLNQERKKARGNARAQGLFDVQISTTMAKLEALERRIKEIGADPIQLPIELKPGHDFGMAIRRDIQLAAERGGNRAAALQAGKSLGFFMGVGMAGALAKATSGSTLKRVAADIGGKISKGLEGISGATIRLGPFTTSIRGAVVGLSLLAPILIDVVGGLGALIGVVGSATMGLGALTAGFLGGFIPAALGFGLVIAGVVREFKEVGKAQKAYDDALRKGNTDLAKKKLEELKATMGNVSDETVKSIASWQKVKDEFNERTAPARSSVWTSIGEGIKTASSLMGMFTSRTNQGMSILEKSTTKWQQALRSAAGQGVLDTLMKNFNASLGPLLAGLGNIIAYLGKVGAVASMRMPGIAKTFENWSSRVLGTADNMGSLSDRVGKTIDSLKSLGRFFMSAGRLMKAFFGGGVDAGQNLLDTMTAAMDRWTMFLSTTQGQKDLGQFFRESVAGAKALYGTLGPVIASFVRWAAVIAPAVRFLLQGTAAVSSFVAELLRLTGLQGLVSGLLTTLGALWAVGRISAATRAVTGFTAALLGMSSAQRAVAATGAASTLLTAGSPLAAAGAGAVGAKAAQSARQVGILRAAAQAAVPAIAGMGAVAGGVATGGLALIAGAAIYGGYKLLTMKSSSEKLRESLEQNMKVSDNVVAGMKTFDAALTAQGVATKSLRDSVREVNELKSQLNKLNRDGKKDTDEYRFAEEQLRAALTQRAVNERDVAKTSVLAKAAKVNQTVALTNQIAATKQYAAALGRQKQFEERLRNLPPDVRAEQQGRLEERIRDTNAAYDAMMKAQDAVKASNEGAIVAQLNHRRAIEGMVPLAGRAAAALARLKQQTSGAKVATKIALKFEDPKDAGAVARRAGAALRSGTPATIVTRIVANSRSADEAIRRLKAVKIDDKMVKILSRGGPQALATIRALVGAKLAPKVMQIMASDASAKSKIAQLIALGIPKKVAQIIANADQAYAEARRVQSQKLAKLRQMIERFTVNPGNLFTPLAPVTQPVRRRLSGDLGGIPRRATGSGDSPATPGTSRAQDRALSRAMSNTLPTSSTGQMTRGARISGPRAIYGEEPQYPEFVITSNPAYRQSNVEFLKQAASSLGVPVMAAKGKGNPTTKPTYQFGKGGNPADLAAVQRYHSLEVAERDHTRQINIEQGKFEEPDTFIRQTGVDESGEPVYAVDEQKVKSYYGNLNHIRDMYDTLVGPGGIMQQLRDAAESAYSALNMYDQKRRANIDLLDSQNARNKELMKSKNKKTADKARARYEMGREMIANQREKLGMSAQERKDIKEDQHDAFFREQEYQNERRNVSNDMNSIEGKARDEAAAANPKPTKKDKEDTSPDLQAQLDQQAGINEALQATNVALQGAVSAFSSPGDIGMGGYANAYQAGSGGPRMASSVGYRSGVAAGGEVRASARGASPAISGAQSQGGWSGLRDSGLADAGTIGGPAGGSGGPTVVINTLHPGDSRTLDAIGRAATAGQAQQGYVAATRSRIGL